MSVSFGAIRGPLLKYARACRMQQQRAHGLFVRQPLNGESDGELIRGGVVNLPLLCTVICRSR